jgi:hypothetical protein
MFKPTLLFLVLTGNTNNFYSVEPVFYFDSDYSEEGREFMSKQYKIETFDPSDLLYKTIIKEIEQEKKLKK